MNGAGEVRVTCEWFALCDRAADGAVSHPILGDVPTCKRCATRLELRLLPFDQAIRNA